MNLFQNLQTVTPAKAGVQNRKQTVWIPASAGMTKAGLRFSGATEVVDGAFKFIQANRTREMLVEDVMGFGVLRAVMDLFRGYFFGTGQLNIPAARERVIREISSILTDNVSSGIAALGLGGLLAMRYGKGTNTFVSFPTVELVRTLSQKSKTPNAFAANLASAIGSKQSEATIKSALSGKLSGAEAAQKIAGTLKQKSFDVTINAERFALNELLDDSKSLLTSIEKKAAGKNWQQTALAETSKILKVKRIKLVCLAVGAVSTIAVPFINRWMTKKIDKIDYYPGEIGLKPAMQPARPMDIQQSGLQLSTTPVMFGNATSNTFNQAAVSPFAQFQRPKTNPQFNVSNLTPPILPENKAENKTDKMFPYVNKEMKNGNVLPLLLSLVPLPFALGLFDANARRFVNPFKKGFGKFLRNAFDFGKGFPFTTQQQMASLFALLISSRLLSSRGKNEFRERLVDSMLGWAVWILGTPVLKKVIARTLEKRTGSQLLKTVGGKTVLKTRSEIEKLLTGAMKQKTLKQFIWLGAGSTIASMIVLGIVEPLIGILLTKKSGASQ